MTWNLRSLILRRKIRRKAIALRDIELPAGLEADLAAIYRRVPRRWSEALRPILAAYDAALAQVVRDDAIDVLTAAIEAEAADVSRLVLALSVDVRGWTQRVERWHRQRWLDVVRQATGIDADMLLDPLAPETPMRAALNRNVGLITGLDDEIRTKVKRQVWDGISDATPRREIGKQLAETIKTGRARADFIARDQGIKASASLDQIRQEEAGIDEYKWRTVEDGRVRPTHAAHNGKIYKWSAAPVSTGHPGHDVNCRCKAQAWIDLIAELEADE